MQHDDKLAEDRTLIGIPNTNDNLLQEASETNSWSIQEQIRRELGELTLRSKMGSISRLEKLMAVTTPTR